MKEPTRRSANITANRAPLWARQMMRRYGVTGWRLGHPVWPKEGKLTCLSCGEVASSNLPPCYGSPRTNSGKNFG